MSSSEQHMMQRLRKVSEVPEVVNTSKKHIAQAHIMRVILNHINGKKKAFTIMTHELAKAMNLAIAVILALMIFNDSRGLMTTLKMLSVAMNNKSHMRNNSTRTREDTRDIMSQATSSEDEKIERPALVAL